MNRTDSDVNLSRPRERTRGKQSPIYQETIFFEAKCTVQRCGRECAINAIFLLLSSHFVLFSSLLGSRLLSFQTLISSATFATSLSLPMDPEAAAHQAKVGQVTLIYATCLAVIDNWQNWQCCSIFYVSYLTCVRAFYSLLFSQSILWYDTLSTLPREFNLVWIPLYKKHFSKKTNSSDPFKGVSSSSSPLSWLSIFLFFTVRYVCNVQFILIIWSVWRVWTPEACLKFFCEWD